MMRSMYSGVSGLKTHQIKMDVIGNNIANVNTVAYKNSSITFSELMYQTTQKASGPNALTGTGGTNARQIGLGVQSAAINTAITSQGATQTTGNPFDLCITGQSFFIVSDGNSNFFTRAGAFSVDAIGNLVMSSNGYNVMGWQVDPDNVSNIKKDTVSALRIMSPEVMTYEPESTTLGVISGILDKNDTDLAAESGKVVNFSFYDQAGYPYTARFSIHNTTDAGQFYMQIDDILDQNGESITKGIKGSKISDFVSLNAEATANPNVSKAVQLNDGVTFASGTYTYKDETNTNKTLALTAFTQTETSGTPAVTVTKVNLPTDETQKADMIKQLEAVFGGNIDWTTVEKITVDDTTGVITVNSLNVAGVGLQYDTDNGDFIKVGGGDTFTLDFKPTVEDADKIVHSIANFTDIVLDMKSTNMYNNSGTSTIAAKSGNKDGIGAGRKMGEMTGITIQTNGKIYASYDNGMTRLMGQIAVAEFANAAGLEKEGENLYSASLNSGEFDGMGVDITASGGYMRTGVLEMSNVDLSTEFTEMITTQRGFQANSRIITVSDTMLEELVNLKR
jgi:flagellar hook protein FlgE